MKDTIKPYGPLQAVKRHFFAMRNGIVADTLRRAGSPHRIIFGLNLPQIVESASMNGFDDSLAEALWNNTSTRESMLLAPMVRTLETFGIEDARRWLDIVFPIGSCEAIDVFCHRLLRHRPYAVELAEELAGSDKAIARYTALRLMFNLYAKHTDRAAAVATTVRAIPSSLTDALAASLVEECELLNTL